MPFYLDPNDIAAIRARLGKHIVELQQSMLDLDVFPSFLFNDDRTRIKQSRDASVQLLDQWVAAEPITTKNIRARLPNQIRRKSVSESLLEAATWSDYGDPLIDLFNYPAGGSRVFTAAPHLLPLLDERGLITVTGLDARPWGLHTADYAFHFHQLLRRDFRAGIHYGLIRAVLEISKQHQLTARLALDDRRLRFKDEYQEVHEADYWYGPSLNEAELDNLAVVGETFHGDPDGGTSLLNPYAGLSIRWTADDNLKIVEIEEYMPQPEPASDWVFARYLHAIRDTDIQAFTHCDGAVKAYRVDKYPREQHDFRYRGKGDRYRKLFRVDGEFPASAWSELACSWFRGNDLINEYFGESAV